MVFRRLFQPQLTSLLRQYCDKKPPQEYFNREGDRGMSKTLTSETLPKDSKIFDAIGATEELLSHIGLAREYAQEAEHEYSDKLKRIQTIIIDLSTAISRSNDQAKKIISKNYTKELEDWILEYSKQLPPPEQYIIPGGGIPSASLHVARAVCRRTERVIVPLVKEGHLHNEALIYLNRLSDFLFIVSRMAAKLDKRTESIYIPKPDEKVQAQ
ncbi:corrinoid adenosyltransferase-like [Tribolium madens]|uniref:corrinoid adenosyltransferase-like n=1 Tax=Tribolium madens TaxID=41895 RepID=UPI001CF74877|nr:corrinoid adenosyltransferase-like [Tribolium madens]